MGYLYRKQVLSKMAENYSDIELVEKLSNADSNAFEFLYRRYFQMVKNLVEKNSGTSDDASDLFQEVMIIIYEKLRDGKFNLSCSMKTFIYSIARNQWLKNLKIKKRQVSFSNFEDYIILEEEPENLLLGDIQQWLKEIGEACRKLLIYFYYLKKSMSEICSELDYSNSDSAKNQKYKCIQRLKKMVNEKSQ